MAVVKSLREDPVGELRVVPWQSLLARPHGGPLDERVDSSRVSTTVNVAIA
jgi:hypothetical protein